jgi:DNA polymerase-4
MAGRVILHSDLNCFYASVEMMEHPELRGKAIAVCGSTEDRHGIVLTKSYPAKAMGVKTGSAIWEAKQKCPGLIIVEPHYDLYLKMSRIVRAIYLRYANDVEPFGMDECWVDVSPIARTVEDGRVIAEEIRQIVKEETGLTVSIGVSFSKIFAKLGSDMKKPDAVTALDQENYREKVWPLPASELLYVGPATTRKLSLMNLNTIGDLAQASPALIANRFGKVGTMLWLFANGRDGSRVMPRNFVVPIKSVGHGTTCVVDLETDYEVWRVLYELAQDVGHRLRENELAARGVELTVKDKDFGWRLYHTQLQVPTQSPLEVAQTAFALFRARYRWEKPVRALTVRGINLVSEHLPVQLDVFSDWERREKRNAAEKAIEEIRRRFGYRSIRAASLMGDLKMAQDGCETVMMPNIMYQ